MARSYSSTKGIHTDQNTLASSYNEKNASAGEELATHQMSTKNMNGTTTTNGDGEDADKKKKKDPSVPIHRLFRFCTPLDAFLVTVACILSMGIGALQPSMILVFGQLLGSIQDTFSAAMIPGSECVPSNAGVEMTRSLVLTFVYMGTGVLVAAYAANAIWVYCGERQARRLRLAYVHSILRQDMTWFDKAEEGSLTTRLAADTQLIQEGISEKFGLFLASLAQFLTGLIISLQGGWKMGLVMVSTLPLMMVSGGCMGFFTMKFTVLSQDRYASAGSIVEQAFSGIKTVSAFSLQSRFIKKYDEQLIHARDAGIMRGNALGYGLASLFFVIFCSDALGMWYGSTLVIKGEYGIAEIMIVFFAFLIGANAFLQLPQNLAAVASAAGAAHRIFATIDRIPEIDSNSQDGISPENMRGDIEFRNVKFVYPTRPDVPILKNLNLKVHPGQTIAFVGPSGSGKSTSISLLQRFYDPLDGQILLDGKNLKDYNVGWLRRQIGVVSQEPVLFNMSIKQNLMMGATREVTHDELINACKKANCHMFITQLPEGYDTMIGGTGLLSGGQKQRIAIARAILKNPSILLLDEATSALDTQSERLVQKALDAASADRTTIVIAHRLSTIRNADLIVVMDQGDLVEQGTHNELLAQGGVYAELVKKQEIALQDSNHTDSELDHDTLLKEEQAEMEKAQDIQIVTEKRDSVNLTKLDSRTSVDAYELKIRKQKEEKKLASQQRAPVWRVIKQMRPEWPRLAVGLVGAAVAGAVMPAFALVFAQVLNAIMFNTPENISPGPMSGANFYSFLFVIIGIGAFFGFAAQLVGFESAGEYYTRRLRIEVFQAYLRQETGFFDDEDHTVGALTSKLAVDAKNVNEMVTKTWGDITQIASSVITGFIIAFINSWTLTLIVLCMAPFIAFATAFESKQQRNFEDSTKAVNEESGQVAGEAISNIRTVASLHRQQHFEDRYFKATDRPHRLAKRKAITASVGYSLQQSCNIYANAVAFYAGMRLMDDCKINFLQMFTSMLVIMMTAQAVGRASVFTSVFAKAKNSAITIFDLLDRTPQIDPDLEGIEPEKINGNISFENITFRYPARPDVPIFNGEFNLHAKSNTTIALVGPSGCGKSTTIGMLERWYDPLAGSVRLDDHNANGFTLSNLRSHMALVSQEPILFDLGTIGDNIRYGVDENKNVTQEEVEEACKSANIHNFIMSLPQGYDTRVGDKGSQLSGGQKQRIAIARALIRKPKILLLDEATSALDSESEKLVQAAIDNILDEKDSGRTTITIAHRLSTIQNADCIMVIKDGRVIEQGSHFELLKLNGVYTELVHQQSLSAN